GFTVGTVQSFYDFYQSPASSFFAPPASNSGDRGWKAFAYTAQYGNGFSATFSIEESRQFSLAVPQTGVINTDLGNLPIGINNPDLDRAKSRFPDLVQNWRVDQAWGSAQVMVAAHDVSASSATGEVQLTTAWGVNAAYDHLWLPNFRTSLYGSYLRVEYGNNANLAICNAQTMPNIGISPFATPSGVAGAIAFTPVQVAQGACNNNFNFSTVASRTQSNF